MVKIRHCIIACIVCVAVALGAVFVLTAHAGNKLNADLNASRWALDSATRDNASLADSIRKLSGRLDAASKLAIGQQQIIDGQKQLLDHQQSIIGGIANAIASGSETIGGEIRAIADGFRQLYGLYHPGAK